jgi:hypothetical protein
MLMIGGCIELSDYRPIDAAMSAIPRQLLVDTHVKVKVLGKTMFTPKISLTTSEAISRFHLFIGECTALRGA